jgi:hypothetical protein
MADFSKIGRNNKNRGRNFERRVAEKLGFTRVPYSGAIKEWGGADVVDGFYTRNGHWALECKTQQPGPVRSISIKHKWVKQMLGAETNGRHGAIVTANVGNVLPGQKQDIYVFMLEDTFEWMDIDEVVCNFGLEVPTRGKGHNFVIKAEDLPKPGNYFKELLVGDEPITWYVIHFNDFVELVHQYDLFVKEVKPDAQS